MAVAVVVLLTPLALAGYLWMTTPLTPPDGVCQSCGYDLRGTSGERCPECGESLKQ